jgi:hypothetical protein
MQLMNIADINPAQTDSSKTAASGELSLNIIIVSIMLVIANPITERNRRAVITVHRAANTNAIPSTMFIVISTLQKFVFG